MIKQSAQTTKFTCFPRTKCLRFETTKNIYLPSGCFPVEEDKPYGKPLQKSKSNTTHEKKLYFHYYETFCTFNLAPK